ncbi:phenylacetate--CoA ligase family protein [candidate division KSB1 bacterium]|nr:phenylacetate--CoA ligase family protein [candidate division KSB1 bacterium]
MISLDGMRKQIFWILDWLKGNPIKRHIQELELSFSSPGEIVELNKIRLNKLLKHACETTEFYKKYNSFQTLSDFPVIQKINIKDNYKGFLSNAYKKKYLITTKTSGSYGVPFVFYLTRNKYYRRLAEILYFNQKAGYRLGQPFVQVRTSKFSRLSLFMNNCVIINPTVINNEWLEQQRQILKNKKFQFLIAWPGVLINIAHYCLQHGDTADDFSIKGIVCSAEPLSGNSRETFEKVFGCPVYDRYASQELGVIAHECKKCGVYHLNHASLFIEILSMYSNKPVEPGQAGRVVVTDLFSHAMPIIRYDTGDIAVLEEKNFECGYIPSVKKIEGRMIETVYNTSGKVVNWGAIGDIIEKDKETIDNIIQYQFIQKNKDNYVIKLAVKDTFKNEKYIYTQFKNLLGQDAHIKFEYVDTIEPLPSGKRPIIINQSFLKAA